MDEKEFKKLVQKYQNSETEKIIGKIDIDLLTSGNLRLLNYAFPLIERIVIEIFKLIPDSHVEKYEQGILKTIIAVIDYNNKDNVIPKEIEEKIRLYFEGECLRNTLFHPNDEEYIDIKSDCNKDMYYIIVNLLIVLNELIKKYSDFDFKDIEYI